MTAPLRWCPFCRGDAQVDMIFTSEKYPEKNRFDVRCMTTGCVLELGVGRPFLSEEEAVKAWNNQRYIDAMKAEHTRLREELRKTESLIHSEEYEMQARDIPADLRRGCGVITLRKLRRTVMPEASETLSENLKPFGASREKYWSEAGTEERIERMHIVVKHLQSTVSGLEAQVQELREHSHQDGRIVIPMNRPGFMQQGWSTKPESSGDYF